jgi:2-succinyl-5-enolpyruvyl-6-hydroxy-3-cyclohexene-1-carboxylate synthase
MAQKLDKPVVAICTSGTAVLNYGPSVAEAFYQQVPLIIISADRPPEWIDQQDGQTIRQRKIFGDLIKKSYQLPDHYDHPDVVQHIHRIVSEAVNESKEYPAGPVHINVPIREPFYPEEGEKLEYTKGIKVTHLQKATYDLELDTWKELATKWKSFKKILIVGGQENHPPSKEEALHLQKLADEYPVMGDVISNLHEVDNTIRHTDIFLASQSDEDLRKLQPDLLISLGRSVISKNLKLFLRKYPANEHWHIQPAGQVADTFQSITRIIRVNSKSFLQKTQDWTRHNENDYFLQLWTQNEDKSSKLVFNYLNQVDFGEFKAVSDVMSSLPPTANLHLANSMSVRLANYVGIDKNKGAIRVVANRGTSGIDGSNGTAVGEAIVSEEPVVLITGDLAFFYDRNAFWHKYDISNLKIVLLNNHAGGIFGMIDGPSRLPELEEYFETKQPLTAKNTAKDFGLEYYHCDSYEHLGDALKKFYGNKNGPALLEIETSNDSNKSIFKEFKNLIKKEFN